MGFLESITKDLIIFDGGMGTMLLESGIKLEQSKPLEIYNIEKPDLIVEIHKAYVRAGAQVITTNTFQANELRLRDSGYSVEEVVKDGIRLAKASGGKYIALDIGPIGQMKPRGKLTVDEVYKIYKRQIEVGVHERVDCILFETFFDISELEVAILAAKENSQIPIIATMTFQEDGKTQSGEGPEAMAIALQEMGIDAIGINCSFGPKEIIKLLPPLLKNAKVPVIVQPNAGIPTIEGDKMTYTIDPKTFGEYGKRMAEMGVRILGGCCGTTPQHIQGIKNAVEDLLS